MRLSLEYVAGFIDGEGCICTGRTGTRSADGKRLLVPRVMIANTDRRVLDLIRSQFGGTIQTVRRPASKPNWKPGYAWRLANSAALDLLERVRPFLIVKAAQADLLLSMRALWRPVGAVWHRASDGSPVRGLSQEIIAQRDEVERRLHELNRKGVAP